MKRNPQEVARIGSALRAAWAIGLGAAAAACGLSEGPVDPALELDPQLAYVTGAPGTVTLCKYTAEPTNQTFDFVVGATVGRVPGNGRFNLSAINTVEPGPECAVAWTTLGDGAGTVTITENEPQGWEVYRIIDTEYGDHPIDGATVTLPVNAASSIVIFFKNRPTDLDMAPGRMTGGGGQLKVDGVYVSRGFTIHCDITLSNNVEVNWTGGNKWHLDKPLTSAVCIDDPLVDPAPPPAPFDTFIGEGVGRLNGVDGSVIRFTFVDAGEPGGRNDRATIRIWAPGADPDVAAPVLVVDGFLDHGNVQAHYDQPHK